MTIPEFFARYPEVAVAFSGGTDSAYLLRCAKQHARRVCAYYVKSEFQPRFELEDAKTLAAALDVELRILPLSVLQTPEVCANPSDRCYYCKRTIFAEISCAAAADGFSVLLDGTNASDDAADRPGMRALRELQVLSPLRLCGLTKAEIRARSRDCGLFTWDKPAYACLATRIAAGEHITAEKLASTEAAEDFLRALGFTDFRVRQKDGQARIQLPQAQWPLLVQHREAILAELKQYYNAVTLDLEVRG